MKKLTSKYYPKTIYFVMSCLLFSCSLSACALTPNAKDTEAGNATYNNFEMEFTNVLSDNYNDNDNTNSNANAQTATAGEPMSDDEILKFLSEYEEFGVSYDKEAEQWYYNGEKVRYFQDILKSNGESLTGGKFEGSIRTLGNGIGDIDIFTVRDFDKPNADGNGTLINIEINNQ